MVLDSGKTTITVVLKAGTDASLYYLNKKCAMLVGPGTQVCVSPAGNITFNGLEKYTDYTVEGWVENSRNEPGARTTAVVTTKADSKYNI